MRDYISEIFVSIWQNKLRTALTGFAVAWGIFMLIVLLGAGNGLMNAFDENSKGLAMNSISVYSGYTTKPYAGFKEGRRVEVSRADIPVLQKAYTDNIEELMAELEVSGAKVKADGLWASTDLLGVYPNFLRIEPFRIVRGRFINEKDLDEARKVVVLNKRTTETLFGKAEPIGKEVEINGLLYQVVGVGKSDNEFEIFAFVPFTTLRLHYTKGDTISNIKMITKNLSTEAANKRFTEQVRTSMAHTKKFDPTDESAVWIWNRFSQYLQKEKGTSILKTALWVVGLFTLLSGIVGVSNIMLITVRERTHEFGIRKALGAKPLSILWLVVTESVVITTFFGYIGMVLGIALTEYMNVVSGAQSVDSGMFSFTYFVNPTVDLSVAIQATIALVIAGTLAGLVPAWKAARIRPIEALRAN